jgi:hypothetical protein
LGSISKGVNISASVCLNTAGGVRETSSPWDRAQLAIQTVAQSAATIPMRDG